MPLFCTPSSHFVRVVSLAELPAGWGASLEHFTKDARYYEIIARTLDSQFDCRFAVLSDAAGAPRAVQPIFLVEQDLIATAPRALRALVGRLRSAFPKLLRLRMLMVGCAAGEGPPGGSEPALQRELVRALRGSLPRIAKETGARLIIWKDVPASFREVFRELTNRTSAGDFCRVASMPATQLPLDFTSFDDYLRQRLSHAARKDLRRKLRAVGSAPPLQMSVVHDVSEIAGEVHALYEQVFARSPLQFELLTPEFFAELGRRMPDRARFFLWRQEGRLVAFSLCLVHDGVISDEYLGLDYRVAHSLHLYFVTLRDVLTWAIEHGLKMYRSTPLNYDPKRRLGFELAPLDLYVRATAGCLQPLLRAALPWIEPKRAEPVLREFPNASEL